MPLDALPAEMPVALCATFDWSQLRPAEKALATREVRDRVERGERPEKLVPLACSRGKFKMGRFVDEDGNVYRLRDVTYVLGEVPETQPDLRAYRRARAWEVGTVVVAVAASPALLSTSIFSASLYAGLGVAATNANGTAKAALARAVTTYNATTFWHATEETYAAVHAVPTSVARATELVHAARGCTVDRADARFLADAELVWGYAKQGYDAGALVHAAEAAPADTGCDLAAALPAGLAVLAQPKAVAEVE